MRFDCQFGILKIPIALQGYCEGNFIVYPNLKMEIWLSRKKQNRLARELQVHETVLSKVINGYRKPTPELRTRLARYFNKAEGWLFQTEPAVQGAPVAKRMSEIMDEAGHEDQ